MLFDLRSRGRRRVIQVVYGFLAILIGGGLVLFGVGGGAGSTGLLSQLAQQGTGSATGVKIDAAAVAKTQRAATAAPSSAAAWDAYGKAVFVLADTNYLTASNGFTSAGAKELRVLKGAWAHYLSLNPAKPDSSLAADVAFAFGQSGIQEYPVAESALEIVAESDATSYSEYAELAVDAYLAKEKDRAKLAEARAVALAPKSQRAALPNEILESAGLPVPSTGSSGSTAAKGSSGSSGSS